MGNEKSRVGVGLEPSRPTGKQHPGPNLEPVKDYPLDYPQPSKMSEATGETKGRFEPKKPVQLDPPKDDPITPEHLAKCDGEFAPLIADGQTAAETGGREE